MMSNDTIPMVANELENKINALNDRELLEEGVIVIMK